jgi:hypothetical protein
MSSPLAQMARSTPRLRSRLWTAVAAGSLLFCGSASAQTASNARGLQNPRIQSAYAEWRRLSQNEVDCIERSLRVQRSSLWSVIQRGIKPSDTAGAALRAACRTQARAPAQSGGADRAAQALAASVERRTELAANSAAADRAAADKAAADKAAADKAAADKVAADKAAAEKVAADKAVADKVAADKAAADRAAQDKAAADKAAADQAIAEQALADQMGMAKAEPGHPKVEVIKTKTEPERLRQETTKTTAEAAFAYVAAEWTMGFVYGMVAGPIIFCFGGVVFLLLSRRRSDTVAGRGTTAPDKASLDDRRDRMVAAVLAEQKRRDRQERPPVPPEREQRTAEAVVY